MYTYCTIRWADDGTLEDVIIKGNTVLDEYDDLIFFYGYDRADLLRAQESGEVLQDGWRVVGVGGTYNQIL